MLPKPVTIGVGVGIGSIQVAITEGFIAPNWHTFGNIIIGGIAIAISSFTNWTRSESAKEVLLAYGFTTAIGGIVQGVFPIILQMASGLTVSPQSGQLRAVSPFLSGSPNGYTARARGFGSYRAAIPTTIPTNTFLA